MTTTQAQVRAASCGAKSVSELIRRLRRSAKELRNRPGTRIEKDRCEILVRVNDGEADSFVQCQ